MSERYKDVQLGKLSDYLTPDRFRTVGEDARFVPPGISEFAVEIHLKPKSGKKLSFPLPWDGIIYGCARSKQAMKEKLQLTSNIAKAFITDWDSKFLLLFELADGSELPAAYVSELDVLMLLENCRRAPEHISIKE